jgi:cyclopropane fatty-acyl-phospholipid synthase-like methyltransferase
MNEVNNGSRWEDLYREQDVEEMPWYHPDLDHDFADAIKEFGIEPGEVLDLGTGPGTQAIALARLGFKVTAVDISKSAIEKAKKRAERADVKVNFLQDDIVNSRLSGKFDSIFDRGCFHVLTPETRGVYVDAVHELMKPNGFLLLKCFSYKEKSEGEPHRFTPDEIKSYFENKFEIISISDSYFQGSRRPLPKALFNVLKKNDLTG